MIAARRSAARSARLEAGFSAGSFGETILGVLAAAARIAARPLAGFEGTDELEGGFFISRI